VAAPTTTSAPSSGPATPNGETRVSGLIASVAGNAAQVTQQSGNATVAFGGSTKVTETIPAALTDVTAGSCVSVRPQESGQGGQPITAASVRVSQAVDGKCPQANGSAPESTPPAPSGSMTPAKRPRVQGAVASVAGNTINVTTTDASGNATQTAVTVSDKTKYSKQAAADTQAISAGKCLTARGTQDSAGALQATTIDLRPAHDGKCAGQAGHHGH
jgi:Domain of unknown function (DUF5666)